MNKEQITAEVLTAFQLPEAGLKELAPYGSGHINDTFLEAYDLTGGNNSSTFENVGSAFANGVNFSNPSWENAAIAFYFYARLDDVFNRCDSYAFTWTSEENFAGCDIFIFQSDFADFFFVNVQNAVFYF